MVGPLQWRKHFKRAILPRQVQQPFWEFCEEDCYDISTRRSLAAGCGPQPIWPAVSLSFVFIKGRGISLFALFYSLGNLCALASTFFLVGPVKQCKRMFAESRIVAALLFLMFLVFTIISAVYHKTPLCLLFCILQFIALTWYSLSYIPYARTAVRSCLTSMC
ncbi:hypothetical protein TcWFU_000081 [Taenia crassiceps]|uniref:Vesicle transport protein n=1 Tax=Taenia crassiceps TaxID=6207 RepID=A0ABR4QAY0_9CEST